MYLLFLHIKLLSDTYPHTLTKSLLRVSPYFLYFNTLKCEILIVQCDVREWSCDTAVTSLQNMNNLSFQVFYLHYMYHTCKCLVSRDSRAYRSKYTRKLLSKLHYQVVNQCVSTIWCIFYWQSGETAWYNGYRSGYTKMFPSGSCQRKDNENFHIWLCKRWREKGTGILLTQKLATVVHISNNQYLPRYLLSWPVFTVIFSMEFRSSHHSSDLALNL